PETDRRFEFCQRWPAALQILKSCWMRLFIWHQLDPGFGTDCSNDAFGQGANGDFLCAPNVENLASPRRTVLQADKRLDSIRHKTKATGLPAITVNPQRSSGFGRLDEARQDHPVAACLPGA